MQFDLPPGAFKGGHCGVQAVAVVAGIGLPRCFRVFQETCRNIKTILDGQAAPDTTKGLKCLINLVLNTRSLIPSIQET